MPQLTPQQQELLAKLKDIQLPEPVGWWPPSQTLIGLMVGLGGILIGLIWYYLTQRRQNRYRREALARLDRITADLADPLAQLQATQALLKQVAITQYGRSRVASLSDADWVAFLHETALYLPQPEHLAATLSWLYRDPSSDGLTESGAASDHAQITEALTYARRWIKGHHK
ncbi:DUF4381 domain-containing protein [Hydrogenovibrio halophilus]|uniref:DUF4381 domain-containing protein n=1 Tax=Hydrogenovibrio halophilus TaxID=373391 RepID=UPI00035CC30E|nr:DUF4381 domain-containing protein [Hydrogenovibrio halophilus]